MPNYMSNAINQAGRAAEDQQDELTPEQIEALRQQKIGMFQKIKNMLGYSYANAPQKQLTK